MIRAALLTLALCGAGACTAPVGVDERVTPTEPVPAATAPAVAEPAAPAPDGWHEGTGRQDLFRVAWRPRTEGWLVPRNRPFVLDLAVAEKDRELAGARVAVRGWMPDHGHGFVNQPPVADLGGGKYLAEGVLLHMRGHWNLIVDVVDRDGRTDSVTFDLEL